MKPKHFKSLQELEKEISAYVKLTQKSFKKAEDLPKYLVVNKLLEETKTLPSSDKNSSTKKKFNDHLTYKELVNTLHYPDGKGDIKYDTWYKDPYYGRVDYKNNLIYHNYWIFQNISSSPGSDICVFDFVADAFDEMKKIFKDKKKREGSTFLQELSAKRGNSSTINPEIKYEQQINQKFTSFLKKRNKELKVSPKIKDFNDFKQIFINFLKQEEGFLTFQGFFNNINVDIYDSYLAFDIYDDKDNPSDSTKLAFLNDTNYDIYESAARQAGFFVDQNKPWRLVANLQSKAIVEAMKRRYKVAEELLKTKDAVYKIIDLASQIRYWGQALEQDFFDYPPNVFQAENAYYQLDFQFSVNETNRLLKFSDYFRKEIPNLENFLKNYKSVALTYLESTIETNPLKVEYGKKKTTVQTAQGPAEVSANLVDLGKSVLNISYVLYDNKIIVDFIFQSLEEQLKSLELINKPIEKITNKDVYNAVYCQISDYAYFTFLPRKLEQFYNEFLDQNSFGYSSYYPKKIKNKSHDSYVVFSKTASGNTKATYNKRKPLDLKNYKLSNNLQNDFYAVDLLVDHLNYRLFEEHKQIDEQFKNEIFNQAKNLYEKSLEEYKENGNYTYYRNLATAIIETFILNLSERNNEIKNLKKAPFFAEQYFYQTPQTEPIIMLERICLTLPERGEILIEQETCGPIAKMTVVAPPTPAPPTPAPPTAVPDTTGPSDIVIENLNKLLSLAKIVGSNDYVNDPPGWALVRDYVEKTMSESLKLEICERSMSPGKVYNLLLQIGASISFNYAKLVGHDVGTALDPWLGNQLGDDAKKVVGWFGCKCGHGKLNCK